MIHKQDIKDYRMNTYYNFILILNNPIIINSFETGYQTLLYKRIHISIIN